MRVLIAEDERRVADALARGLRREGLAVDVARDGADALLHARIVDYDVVVLDRELPELHGDEVLAALGRERPGTRVLMLTGLAAPEDVVGGLTAGADDYLTKPFRFDELLARVRALGRRAGGGARPAVLRRGDVELDVARREATRAGRPLGLVPKELAVLEVLLGADGAVVSGEELLQRAWDEHADPFTNAVRQTVMTLRRKLGEEPFVLTVVGAGYRVA